MTLTIEKMKEEALEYKPTDQEQDALNQIRRDWENAREQKNRAWRHLRNRDIETFMRDCRDHYNGYVDEADTIEDDWKSRAFKRKTRNKVIATVASFLSSGLGLDINALDLQERLDSAMSKVVNDVFMWSLDRENFDYTLLRAMLEMTITGTCHIYEDLVWEKRDVKEIVDMDFASGKVKFEKAERVKFKGAKAEFVPNSEMYPGDIWTHDIQEQPYVVRRQLTTYEEAARSFDKFDNWKYVQPGGAYFLENTDIDNDEIEDASDVDLNQVEIVQYWSTIDDIYAIVVNGVLLSEPDYPIPYPHKQYPFAKAVFEPHADQRFYWGDSLANKNWDDQEAANQLWRMFIDSTKLKNKPPLFTPELEMSGTDLVIPGAVNAGTGAETVRTIDAIAQGVSNSEFNMLSLIEQQTDENSVDPLLSGQQAQGDPTATEVRAIVGSAERARAFNEQFIADLLIQHAHLRVPNILWFLTNDEEYNRIVIDKGFKSGKKEGKKYISFVHAGDLPSPVDLFRAEKLFEKNNKEMIKMVFVDKGAVNDYRFHIQISPTKTPTRTAAARISRVFAKYRLYSQNEFVDQAKNTRVLMLALGDDPDDLIKEEQIAPQQMTPGGAPKQGAPRPQKVQLPPGAPSLEAQLAPEKQAEEAIL